MEISLIEAAWRKLEQGVSSMVQSCWPDNLTPGTSLFALFLVDFCNSTDICVK
ncbi:hypothetical protein PP1Y_AT3466 [Novosphingobium sp. PP1Y]|nr:hypothetical protein PP1Y_AT3466 [Novosphingobium sp. PP1Y]